MIATYELMFQSSIQYSARLCTDLPETVPTTIIILWSVSKSTENSKEGCANGVLGSSKNKYQLPLSFELVGSKSKQEKEETPKHLHI